MSLAKIQRLLIGLAEFYNEELTETKLKLYSAVLQDLAPERLEWAIGECFKDPQITRMPLPAKLREMIRPTVSIEDATQELLGRCLNAVGLFGVYQPNSAHAYLGETVWAAIGREAGWVRFCMAGDAAVGGIAIGTARAQLRDAIKARLHIDNPSGRVAELPIPKQEKLPELPNWDPMQALESANASRDKGLERIDFERR